MGKRPVSAENIGLTTQRAEQLLEADGENTIGEEKKACPVLIFFSQFKDILVVILLISTVVSFFLGEMYDAITIILIVLSNSILGFIQEYRTEKTLEALKSMVAPTARAYRDGVLTSIPAAKLVKGDVIAVEAGDRVPADAVILSAQGLLCDESILTGEALPVEKYLDSSIDYNSLYNPGVLYSGTVITKGHAECEVFATGKNQQVGKISGMIAEADSGQTPLQKRLGELGKSLALICLIVCVVVFGAGVLRGEPVFDMLMTGITIAIAAIPEGLPATVTIALAIAVRRMLKQKALVHRLHSVETLGCTSVICSDKTGTITENRMTAEKIITDSREYDLLGSGYRISGEIRSGGVRINPTADKGLCELLRCAVVCTSASIHTDSEISTRSRGEIQGSGEWHTNGDPTEVALLIAAAKCGFTAERIRSECRKISEIPFDSDSKCMSVTVNSGGITAVYTKGAADILIERCTHVMTENGIAAMTLRHKSDAQRHCDEMSDKALRVLALAAEYDGGGMTLLGLVGMLDKPREEAKRAIRTCARAGIKTVMITGDHKNTAVAVARQAGIITRSMPTDGAVITGAELDAMSDEQLTRAIEQVRVFARVNPSHKLRIVRAFKARKHIVTMTGDGVNDAPAIKEADIGVAMGITGTDVTRQAADLILLDDNLATLVSAVEQGRGIYANIRKFVRYLLSCNIGEVLTMFVGILMGMPVVLLPTQLLLVNLVTDGLPAVALGVEPTEDAQMDIPPRHSDESFFSHGLAGRIIFREILIALFTLAAFSFTITKGGTVEAARTAALLTLVMSQLFHVFECKSENGSIFTVPYLNNPKLICAVLLSVAVIFAAIYIPQLQPVFRTVPLNSHQLAASMLLSIAAPVISALFGGKSTAQESKPI